MDLLLDHLDADSEIVHIPESWINDGSRVGGCTHATCSDWRRSRQRYVAQVTLRVLVRIVTELGTLRYLSICKLYVPVFEGLCVHQFSGEVVPCQPETTEHLAYYVQDHTPPPAHTHTQTRYAYGFYTVNRENCKPSHSFCNRNFTHRDLIHLLAIFIL